MIYTKNWETNNRTPGNGNNKVESDGIAEKLEALQQEMQNKFAYLVDLIESPLAKIRYLCDIYNALYQNERVLAAIDPTLYIRGKLNDSSLYAVHAGNYIVVYPCYKLENLTFIVEKEKCHNGVPVSYNLRVKRTRDF